mgnify:CR=1 FL=1
MKQRAQTPTLSVALSLTLLAFGTAGCRIIPEGSGPPPSAPQPPSAPVYQLPISEAPPSADPEYLPPPSPPAAPSPLAPAAPISAPYKGPPLAYTRIGETVYVDGPKVTPLSLIEDSRCPQGVQCVQAGRLRLHVRVDLGSGPQKVDLTLGQPLRIADGTLTLLDARPGPVAGVKPAPLAYQFGFRFMGGI